VIRHNRALQAGLAAAVLYLAVLSATAATSTHHVRPLFEGIGPAAPYRWVNPPKEFAAGNQPPSSLDTSIEPGKTASLNTPDGQAIVNLAANAIPAHDPDTEVRGKIDPLDPATLGPLPAPLRADGNAYRVNLTYTPSGTPVGALSAPGNIALQIPEPADAIFFSTDGTSWQKLPTQTVGQPTLVGAAFAQPGLYLAATSAPAANTSSSSGSTWPAYAVFAATIMLAAALGVLAFVRRRRRPAPAPRSATRSARPAPPNRSKNKKRRR
jgi:hypothetical protein